MSDRLPRHVAWKKEYLKSRYMAGITDDELDLRFADVMTNVTVLTSEGKLGISGLEWLEKFSHLQMEYGIRNHPLPDSKAIDRRLTIPDESSVHLGAKVRRKFSTGAPDRLTLFKYGKAKHLTPLFEKGHLRLLPASSYDDPSLNVAIEDSELRFEKVVGAKRVRYVAERDFYCFCASFLHSDRLIADFNNADCVLVILDPHEFFLRLASALDEPRFFLSFDRVTYIDPLLLGDIHPTNLAYIKHMRFAYQFEHRFVAVAPKQRTLRERHVVLGSLRDIAEIYVA